MKRPLLLLGTAFSAAFVGAESSEIPQILEFARHLQNQTLGSAFPKTQRRMQSSQLPDGCADACAGMQCVFSESMALTQRAEEAQSSGMSSLDAILSVAQDSLGLMCNHSATLSCGYENSACEPFLDAVMAPLIAAGIVAPPDCMCQSCPNYPLVMGSMASVSSLLTSLLTEGGSPTQEQEEELLTAVCPMAATLECMGSQASCAEFMQGSTGSLLTGLNTLQTGCATLGKALDYATSYEFTPTCTYEYDEETNGVGLQLNFLAGVCLLLSILK